MQTEALEDLLRAGGHALVLGARLLGRRDRHELDLFELVLTDHAPRVLARGPRFRPKGQSSGGEPHRQGSFVDDALAPEICQRHFGGGDQAEPPVPEAAQPACKRRLGVQRVHETDLLVERRAQKLAAHATTTGGGISTCPCSMVCSESINCSGARSSRASAPFNTTKRAPDSF